jgi:large subunit ribosomal protein L23
MIRHPVNTEKSIRMMEADNKLVFIVDRKDKKADIKKMLEEQFKAKITNIQTVTSIEGVKKAIVRFSPETPAIDIATKMGMM